MGELGSAGATIGDVAAAAGVSRATVSRVMNGRRVASALAERVQRAAADLDYRPSALARSLSLGRTHAVGVVVPDLTNPMFLEVMRGIAAASDAAGYGMVVAETQERADDEAEVVRNTSSRVDALVLVAPRAPDEVLAGIVAHGVPVVLVNRTLPEAGAPAVGVDYAEAAAAALEYLIDLGHRSVVYLAGPPNAASHTDRLAGLATARASFPGVGLITLACGASMTDGSAAAEEVLATGATAVIAYDDLVAFGLLARLRELGVDVPGRISVLGFDDVELARFGTPPLTTVAVPHEELGRRAWDRLAELLDAGAATRPADVEVVRTRLVVRGSTGPSPDGPTARPTPPGDADAAAWRQDVSGTALRLGGTLLAGYATAASPPYLHPIRARNGTRLTAAAAVDDRRHRGLSLQLDGHRATSSGARIDATAGDGALRDVVAWAPGSGPRTTEHRTLRARALPGGWALRWESELSAPDRGADAPAGRLLWRFSPVDEARLSSADAVGDAGSHATAPWIALALRTPGAWTTVVLARDAGGAWQATTDPVVTLALTLSPADAATRIGLTALVLDGLQTPEAIADRWYPEIAGLFPALPPHDTEDEARGAH